MFLPVQMDLEAAQLAEKQREEHIKRMSEFCFETVLSTERNLNLLVKAKEKGYFIRCYYILTADPVINVWRIRSRVESGGIHVINLFGYLRSAKMNCIMMSAVIGIMKIFRP